MSVNQKTEETVRQLCDWYGDGADGSSPTDAQWRQVLSRPADRPLTLINLFKLRGEASYDAGEGTGGRALSGQEAFGRYAAVSMPAMQRIGGSFLHAGPYAGTFLGADEDWDMIAIGAYPGPAAFMALYTDADYRAAFRHRRAACARQKVLIATQ